MTGPLIELRGIEKDYLLGSHVVPALRGVDLTIDPGELVAVTGPSGSGKSSLLAIAGCLDVPTRGSYRLLDGEVAGLSTERLALIRNRVIGFVFQSYHLLPRLSAARNVELPLVFAGVPGRERRRRALDALEAVGLGGRSAHVPSELSGGERQRVAVARALVTEPSLILADEPTGNLDTRSGEAVLDLFRTANRERGITVVVVTHDRHVAASMDREIAVEDGRVLHDGTPRALGDRWSEDSISDLGSVEEFYVLDESAA